MKKIMTLSLLLASSLVYASDGIITDQMINDQRQKTSRFDLLSNEWAEHQKILEDLIRGKKDQDGEGRTPIEMQQDDNDREKLQDILMISKNFSDLDPYNFRNAYYFYCEKNGIHCVIDENKIEDRKEHPFKGFDFSGLNLSDEDKKIIETIFTSDRDELIAPVVVLSTIKNVRPEKVLAHYIKDNRSNLLFIINLMNQPYIMSVRYAKKILKSYCTAYPNINPAGTPKGNAEIKLNDFFGIPNTSSSKSTDAKKTPQAPTTPAAIAATVQIQKTASANLPTVISAQTQVSTSTKHPTSNILTTYKTNNMQSIVIPTQKTHSFNWQFKPYLTPLAAVTDDQKTTMTNYIQSLSQDDYTYLVSLAHIKKTTPEYILAAYMQTPSNTLTSTTSILDVATWYLNNYTVKLQTTAESIKLENDLHASAQTGESMLSTGFKWLKSWF